MIFKCKICGGSLEIGNNERVFTCEYCGTQQTLPKLDNEKRCNLYDRANHFRRNNEFDKAMDIYEKILNEDKTDSEAYWSIVLCRYGIEYVEDPAIHKRLPTINRSQFTSVFDDEDYKSAIKYADNHQKSIYESEAEAINQIQKGILAISQKEEPFDVFICYKESDNNGRRTSDSVLAQELYFQLKQEGFKVFFSRITLEDKLGSAYEPYIFAALNSAKVMVVIGTKPEHFNAVWVKNEWSRFLSLIKNGAKKTLVPAYKDMNPYDLPEEFSHLQAQDMSKLGFMQDLIRGIRKITEIDENSKTVVKKTVITSGSGNIAPLLERVFMFLEDNDWQSADEYCEKVLDLEPKCAEAYMGKLMAELHVNREGNLKDCDKPFDNNSNYQKAIRFGDEKLKAKLNEDIEYINNRNEKIKEEKNKLEKERQEQIAKEKAEKSAKTLKILKKIAIVTPILCVVIAFVIVLNTVIIPNVKYNNAVEMMDDGKYEEAVTILNKLGDYKNSKAILKSFVFLPRKIKFIHSDSNYYDYSNVFQYEYDEKGNKVMQKELWAEGGGREIKYEYNEKGDKVTEKGKYLGEHQTEWESKYENEYDKTGNLVKVNEIELFKNSDGTQKEIRNQYEYDKMGNLVKEPYGVYKYIYDSNGNILKCIYGIIGDMEKIFTYDENSRIIEEKYFSQSKLYEQHTYEYNEKGDISKDISIGVWGNITQEYLYEYDDDGNIIKMVNNCTQGDGSDWECEVSDYKLFCKDEKHQDDRITPEFLKDLYIQIQMR